MTVAFKKLSPEAVLPAYAHPGDAGMDVCSVENLTVAPGGRALVHTGLAMALPPGYEAQVRPRSGLALKRGVTVLNTPGDQPYEIKRGDRIAQMVIAPVTRAEVVEVGEVDSTDRGAGGFGSTGV